MSIRITHAKVSGKAAGNDPTRVYGTHWDEDHTIIGAVSNDQLDSMEQATIKGRESGGGTGAPQDLTGAQVRAIAGAATASTDHAIVRFDGDSGATQNSGVTISDADVVSGAKVLPTWAGTARTLEARFSDVINVKDYGAVGDGIADDAAAIQQAIDASLDNNVQVLFPAGRYLCGAQLTASIPAGQQLCMVGDGKDSSEILFPDGSGIAIAYEEYTSSVSLLDFSILTGRAGAGSDTGLRLYSAHSNISATAPVSTVRVAVRADDAFTSVRDHYWDIGIRTQGVVNINFEGLELWGDGQGFSSHGVALQLDSYAPPYPAWNSGTTYALGDLVSYNSRNYRSLQNSNTNHTPNGHLADAWWLPLYSGFAWNINTAFIIGWATGVLYGDGGQGLTIAGGTNIVGNVVGVKVSAGYFTGLQITNTQFATVSGSSGASRAIESLATELTQVEIADSLFISYEDSYNIYGSFQSMSVVGNSFAGPGSGYVGTYGAHLTATSTSATFSANTFVSLEYGISTASGVTNVIADESNLFHSNVTNPIQNGGSQSVFSYTDTANVEVDRNATQNILLGTIAADKRAINIAATFNNGALNFEAPLYMDVTDTASGSASRLVDIKTSGTSRFYVDKNGNTVAGGNILVPSEYAFQFFARSYIQSPADGNIVVLNNAGNSFGLLQFGGGTSSFPAIKRSGTGIQIRLADDSAYAPLTAGATTSNGLLSAFSTTDSSSVQVMRLEGDRATPTNFDFIYASFYLSNAAGTQVETGRVASQITSVTAGSHSSEMLFSTATSGTIAARLYLRANALYPATNDSMALGGASLSFADLFLASGGVINFANSNYTVTHSSGLLTTSGPLTVTGQTIQSIAAVTDGVTAPSATVGLAKIYVDTADGDLKVIFGDGTVKVLAADT